MQGVVCCLWVGHEQKFRILNSQGNAKRFGNFERGFLRRDDVVGEAMNLSPRIHASLCSAGWRGAESWERTVRSFHSGISGIRGIASQPPSIPGLNSGGSGASVEGDT